MQVAASQPVGRLADADAARPQHLAPPLLEDSRAVLRLQKVRRDVFVYCWRYPGVDDYAFFAPDPQNVHRLQIDSDVKQHIARRQMRARLL